MHLTDREPKEKTPKNLSAKFQKRYSVQAISYSEFKNYRAKSVDPDEVAHLHCLQILFLSLYNQATHTNTQQ